MYRELRSRRGPKITMTDKSNAKPVPDPEFDAKVADYRRRCHARIAEIKRDLQRYLAETTDPIGDYVVVSTALLELACERYLETHEDAVEAADFIQTVFRRVVSRRNGPLR
jgi:hypothetical protein